MDATTGSTEVCSTTNQVMHYFFLANSLNSSRTSSGGKVNVSETNTLLLEDKTRTEEFQFTPQEVQTVRVSSKYVSFFVWPYEHFLSLKFKSVENRF